MMTLEATSAPYSKLLTGRVLLYGLAVHFTHNAEYLSNYPNLPEWFTRSQIDGTWFCSRVPL